MTRSLVVAVVAVCAIVAAVPADAAKRRSCYRFGGTTVVQSPKIRIFFKYHEYDDGARYYGLPPPRREAGVSRRGQHDANLLLWT
jgi:hypothetical protein